MRTRLFLSPLVFLSYHFACIAAEIPGSADAAQDSGQNGNINSYDKRLAWQHQTLVGGYESVGVHNQRWDQIARAALENWAEIRADPKQTSGKSNEIRAAIGKAIRAGCDDPLIGYLRTRFAPPSRYDVDIEPAEGLARLTETAADDLEASGYNEAVKFEAHFRAFQALTTAINLHTNLYHSLSNSRMQQIILTGSNLVLVARAGTAPVEEIYLCYKELLEATKRHGEFNEWLFKKLEPALFRNYTNEALAWLIKAEFSTRAAWNARGSGTADRVKESVWPLWDQRLKSADEAMRQAWALDPMDIRIPLLGITVEMGLGRGRDKMEVWFERAMSLDPSNVNACYSKMYYLEPRWHGSEKEVLAFGHECADSQKWGGRVPLVLAWTHERLAGYLPRVMRTNYWRQPPVWDDIKKSYTAYFTRNPTRSPDPQYARFAFWCGRWDEFIDHVSKLPEATSHWYFGGKEEFDRMIGVAKANSSKKNE